jgi:cytochrome c2
MRKIRALVFILLPILSLCLPGCQAKSAAFSPEGQEAELVVELEDGATQTIPFPELYKIASLPGLSYDDHLFGEKRRYVGLDLNQLRQLSQADDSHQVLKLHCRDGYVSEVETRVLEQGQFMLAIRDLDAAPATFLDYDQMVYLQNQPAELTKQLESRALSEELRAELIQERDHKKTLARDLKNLRNQGPFYPVFIPNDGGETWFPPFCVDKITFAKTLTDKTAALPDNLPGDHPAQRGSELFQSTCSSCHRINGIGGQVGPELNRPMSVTEYWDETTLRQMMKDPSQVRDGSKMPAFHLKDEKIDDIVAYLKWMGQNKKI